MPILKIANQKTTKNTTASLSSDVSSSVSGNMDLIQYQIGQKSNDYINVKNAVKILEQYSNWNGYIKIYTEIENNFNTGDTVYITYTETPDTIVSNIFNLENPSDFDNPFDESVDSRFYIGYKVLYTNKYKNEIVINRYYNDIGDGKLLKNQYLSKISCRGGNFYNDIADGVVFFDCNIFDGEFATITGYISGQTNSGITTISNATLICVGLTTTSNANSHYSLNVPSGINIVKCYATGYITNTFYINIATNETKVYDILMLSGTNSITISANTTSIYTGQMIIFTSSTIGYDEPVNYQWKINGINVGTNTSTFSYNLFVNNDVVTCEVSDDFETTSSNEITITVSVTTTTTTPSPISSFSIKYALNHEDACNGTSSIVYSLIPSPTIGTILYKNSGCTQPWDTLEGNFMLFVNPAIFGNGVISVDNNGNGEIIGLNVYQCLPVTTSSTTPPGPIRISVVNESTSDISINSVTVNGISIIVNLGSFPVVGFNSSLLGTTPDTSIGSDIPIVISYSFTSLLQNIVVNNATPSCHDVESPWMDGNGEYSCIRNIIAGDTIFITATDGNCS